MYFFFDFVENVAKRDRICSAGISVLLMTESEFENKEILTSKKKKCK